MNRTTLLTFAVLGVLAASVAGAIAFSGGSSPTATDKRTDRAFAQQMVPHHRDAVAMARIAEGRAARPELKALAKDIIAAQTGEITTLQRVDARLGKAGVTPGELGNGGAKHSMPMDGGSTKGMPMDPAALRGAKPFDRAFIDMMIPHHQSAIVMARDELARGTDSQVRTIARQVIAAQSREIQQMNGWRQSWYGATSPAGGIPAA